MREILLKQHKIVYHRKHKNREKLYCFSHCYQACLPCYKVFYKITAKVLSALKLKADGSHLRKLSRIEKEELLILDDFGIQSFDASGRALLMDIIEDRHGKHATIIASQVPVKNWYDVIGEQTVADAILDRLVHQSIRIELMGESLRKLKIQATILKQSDNI